MNRQIKFAFPSFIAWFALNLFLQSSLRADEVWMTDLKMAGETAAREDKDLFVLFTGSDWCPPCKKMEKDIFSKVDFLSGAEKNWVLVKIDFPRENPLPESQKAANDEIAATFGITGFPTIVLMDGDYRPIGFLNSQTETPVAMLEALRDVRQNRLIRDEAFKAAEQKTGEESARAIDRGLSVIGEEIARVWYGDFIEKIVEIDSDNRMGLREKWFGDKDAEIRKEILSDIDAISRLGSPEEAILIIDEVLETYKFPVEEKFDLLRVKLGLLQQSGAGDAALKLMDEMLAMEQITEATRERLMVKKALQLVSQDNVAEALQLLQSAFDANGNLFYAGLTIAQIKAREKDVEGAIALLSGMIPRAARNPDSLVELIATRADLTCSLGNEAAALEGLEQFANDTSVPADLRAEALLQAAIIMRDSGRTRPAILTENRAVSLATTPEMTRELQRVVDALRK